MKFKIKGKTAKIWAILFLFFLLWQNLQGIKKPIREGLSVINPTRMMVFADYQQKMRLKIGAPLIDYYEFVRQNTPENAVILLPPQGFPWPMTGNIHWSRYFWYPRRLLNGAEFEAKVDLKKENIQYVLLTWGETEGTEYDFTHGWPKFFLPAKQIIYKKYYHGQVANFEKEIVNKDLDPADPTNKYRWGIIEVDKERL